MRLSNLRTTLSPIGTRADGSLIWPFFGAQPDDGSGGDGGGDGGDGDGGDGDGDGDGSEGQGDGIGDAGKAAIDAERKRAERYRKSLGPWAQLRKDTGLSVEEIREKLLGGGAGGSGGGKGKDGGQQDPVDVEAIRREERLKAREQSDKRYRNMAVKAAAASVLEDADDAVRYLDMSRYEVDDDGEIDQREIKRDLDALIADRPYLAKAKKAPDFEGGPRGGGGSKPTSMSEVIRRQAGVIR